METPVVFEGEAVTRVIEIWPAEKSPFVVVQRDLCLWPRQPTEHSTIRRRDSIGDSAAGSAKPTTRRRLATPKYLARLTQRSFKSRRLTSRARSAMSVSTTASVTFSRMLRSLNVRRTVVARWAANGYDIVRAKCRPSNVDSRSRRDADPFRDCHFNRFARFDVEAVQPSSRETGEDRPRRPTASSRLELELRSVGQTRPRVHVWTHSSPARTLEMPSTESCSERILKRERPGRELSRHERSSPHKSKDGI
jgi:hypothetical protein